MDPFRLDSVSTRLANLYRSSTTIKRRQAALMACRYALESAGLFQDETSKLLDLVDTSDAVAVDAFPKVSEWANELDEVYLKLSDAGEQSSNDEVMKAFSKARAATAVAFALAGGDSQLHESIYEAYISLADPSELTKLLEECLK